MALLDQTSYLEKVEDFVVASHELRSGLAPEKVFGNYQVIGKLTPLIKLIKLLLFVCTFESLGSLFESFNRWLLLGAATFIISKVSFLSSDP